VEILTYLYFYKMRHRPDDPKWPERDRLILSKGHAAPALYAMLQMSGYFPIDELFKLRRVGGSLQGHPDMLRTRGVEFSTGSLGQGLSVANGIALGLRLNRSKARVYVIMGDGELQEGQVWEAAMSTAHYKLCNLTALVDSNRLQIDGRVEDVMNIEPLAAKWRAFGWYVQTVDGHSFAALDRAIGRAQAKRSRPGLIVAQTVKGKGVSFMEGKPQYHGVAPTREELLRAMEELGGEVLLRDEG